MNQTSNEFRSGAFTYFAFVLCWSAFFWLLSAVISQGQPPERSILFLTGGAGPLIGAVVFTHLRESRATQRDFWRRALDPSLLSSGWFSISLLLHPALILIALIIDCVLGVGPTAVSFPQGGITGWLSLMFFTFWFGPLPEEIGWRGYALDRLQGRRSSLEASLILGVIWACWHLPLFAVRGTFQHSLGFNNPRFWFFMSSMVPLSIIMTWIYNSSGRSTLSAAFVHFSGNLCGTLIPKSARLAGIEFVLLTLCSLALVFMSGAKYLACQRTIDIRLRVSMPDVNSDVSESQPESSPSILR